MPDQELKILISTEATGTGAQDTAKELEKVEVADPCDMVAGIGHVSHLVRME